MALEDQIDRLNVNIENLIAALGKAPGWTPAAAAQAAAPATPTPAKAPKNSPKTSQPPAAETASQPPVAASPAPVAAEAATITKDQTKLAIVALIKKDGNQTRATEVLAKHGATNLSTLAPEHYAAVHAEATKLVA